MNKRNKIKNTKFVIEDYYRDKVLRTMIILCWIVLAVCFAVKLFGGNFFEIVCNNRKFIKICKYIDNTFLYYIVSFCFYFITNFIFLNAISTKIKISKINMILILAFMPLGFLIKYINMTIGVIIDIFIIEIMIPFIILKNENVNFKNILLNILISFVLINGFQLISLFIKNLGLFKVMENNSLVQIIFSIDYIIMLVLYLLYRKKLNIKKEKTMGFFGVGWLHKEITKCEAIKSKNLKRIEELQDENKEIDAKIAELKKQEEGK